MSSSGREASATIDPRIEPGSRAEVGRVSWAISRLSGRVTGTGPPNLFLTLARRPSLFVGWLIFASRLMPGGKLPRRDTELVILRVAELCGCEYERAHHVRLGKRAGLTDLEIDRVSAGPDAPGWSDRDRSLLAAVDELQATHDLSDDAFDGLRGTFPESSIVELIMLVGHYQMLAQFIATLRVQTDAHPTR